MRPCAERAPSPVPCPACAWARSATHACGRAAARPACEPLRPPGAQAALSLVLIPPLVAGVTWILLHTGPWLPFALWAFMFGVQLAALTVYPVLIAPLFNKFDALPPGPLRRALGARAHALLLQPLH
jgi:hypothetical protein